MFQIRLSNSKITRNIDFNKVVYKKFGDFIYESGATNAFIAYVEWVDGTYTSSDNFATYDEAEQWLFAYLRDTIFF